VRAEEACYTLPVTRLIVNADDFGLTSGVNRAIVELHQAGVLTSTTLMARAQATDEAIRLAGENPGLGIGCHVVLVDGQSQLDPSQLPTLTDATTGLFHAKLGGFLLRLLAGRIRSSEIERESSAQIARLQSAGIRLTHIDAHKHTHMFPGVLRPILRAARRAGVRVVRNPFEPYWSVAATPGAPFVRRAEVHLLRLMERRFHQIVAQEGFTTTAGSLGVLATGTLDAATVSALLSKAPEATYELVSHPGYNDTDLAQARTRLLASREQERQALLAVAQHSELELVNFSVLHS